MWIETSGLPEVDAYSRKFIRQQWRMWIETASSSLGQASFTNSFASNGECGLKQPALAVTGTRCRQFIRQQWRMWIETKSEASPWSFRGNSFASNGECGLKRCHLAFFRQHHRNSFASNGECGLKRFVDA